MRFCISTGEQKKIIHMFGKEVIIMACGKKCAKPAAKVAKAPAKKCCGKGGCKK